MKVQWAQQVQEGVGKSARVIITERGDDVALLIGQMIKMGWPEVLDRPSPRHGKQRGRSWGWTAVIGLAYRLTEGAHRQVSVEAYSQGMHTTLSHLRGQALNPRDFRDDRLGHLLQHWSKPTSWHKSARDVHARSSEGYALPPDVIRGEAPTISGAHAVTTGGRWQFGQSKDDPTRPPIQGMMGALDP